MSVLPAHHPQTSGLPFQRVDAIGALLFTGLLAALIAIPIAELLPALPGELIGAERWRAFLLAPLHQLSILQSTVVTLLATGLAGLLALPIAGMTARAGPGARRLLLAVGMIPLLVPSFVWAAFAQDAIALLPGTLARFFVDWPSLLLVSVYTVHLSPVMLLALTAALVRMDRAQTESARCHGIGDITAWYRVTLPQLTPAYVLGSTVIALRVLADVGAPGILGIDQLLAVQASHGRLSDPNFLADTQATLVLVLVSAGLVVLSWRHLVVPLRPTTAATTAPDRPGSLIQAGLAGALLAMLASLPVAWLVARAGGSLPAVAALDPARLLSAGTLQVAAAASLVFALLGLPTIVLSQQRTMAGQAVRWLLPLTLILPTPVLAGLYRDSLPALGLAGAHAGDLALILSTGLAIVIPLLVVLPHLAAHLPVKPAGETAELAHCSGIASHWPAARMVLPVLLTLSFALLAIGLALGLGDLGAAVIGPQRLALEVSAAGVGSRTAEWAGRGLLLTTLIVGPALVATLLLQHRGQVGRPIAGLPSCS
jgi:ABC-type Fe3+ transport system permease subunit